MAGRGTTVSSGKELENIVAEICETLGLRVRRQVRVARRIWGKKRMIDVVVENPATRKRLGIECKYQGVSGSAEEKIYATLQDIQAWPIAGIVVIGGDGFSESTANALIATGKVILLEDLEDWLRLFFDLPLGEE